VRDEQRGSRGRRAGVAIAVAALALTGASMAACVFALNAFTANYDGFVSFFNVYGWAGCCIAVLLLGLVPVAVWAIRDYYRND
jgi:hypothetical protein